MSLGRCDIAKHVLHLRAGPKPDGGGVVSVYLLEGIRRLFEQNVPQGNRERSNRTVVAHEEIKHLLARRTPHGNRRYRTSLLAANPTSDSHLLSPLQAADP